MLCNVLSGCTTGRLPVVQPDNIINDIIYADFAFFT